MGDEKQPPRTKSGQSPAVQAFRQKMESINEGTLVDLEELNRDAADLAAKHKSDVPPPPKDPRREEEGEPPADVVPPESLKKEPKP